MMLKAQASDTGITHGGRLWLYVATGLVLAYLVLPALLIVPMSFSGSRYLEFPPRSWSLQWYQAYFGSPEWQDATIVSLEAAALTTLVSVPLGLSACYALRLTTSWVGRAVGVALSLPMIVPVIFIGIGLFFVYARLGINNTLLGIVLGHTLLALPFVVITVEAGLKSFDMNQEMAARSLGASRARAFFDVVLPQIKLVIISAALFAFITSLDEVVVALFVSGGENATLPRLMFSALRDEIDPTIAAISSLLTVISVGVLIVVQVMQARRG